MNQEVATPRGPRRCNQSNEVMPLRNTHTLSKINLVFEATVGGDVRIFGVSNKKQTNKQTEKEDSEVVSCLPYPSGRHHRLIFGLPIFPTNLVRGLANNEMGCRDRTTDVARQHDTGRPQGGKNSGGLNPAPGEHTRWFVDLHKCKEEYMYMDT